MNTLPESQRLWSARPELIAWYLQILPAFLSQFPGYSLAVGQTYRSPIQQQAAASAGRSKADGVSKFSLHQWFPSEAIDLVAYAPDGTWITDGKDQTYQWLGHNIGVPGIIWGGTFGDWDHFERAGQLAPGPDQVAADFAKYQAACRASGFLV